MLRGAVIALLLASAGLVAASDPPPETNGVQASTVAELEHAVSQLQAQLKPPSSYRGAVGDSEPGITQVEFVPPAVAESPVFSHGVVYDDGWTLRPVDSAQTPFELKIALHNQFRYTGFAADEPFVINSAGQPVSTPNRNDFAVNRGRLVFSGYAIDPLLEFYANVDYNTVADQQIQMLMAWIRHPFDPAFNVAYGLGKVPGTWEWQESARWTLGAERSLATTFFRPSMTAGIWAEGELRPGLHYHALIGDGFNTTSLKSTQLDDNLAFSGMLWWEPLGDFGRGFSDLECHPDGVLRLGQALTFSRQDDDPVAEPGPEQTVVRLSDGTRLVEPGALAPGVTVNQFDLTLYAIHAGWKRRGCSLTGEYFLRWLTNIGASGPIPEDSIFDHGLYVQSGTFVVPQSVEIFGRGSAVYGPFGNGSELGGGVNWYIKNKREWRFTLDAARVDDSPAQQDRTGFVAGASGLLVRIQVWTSF